MNFEIFFSCLKVRRMIGTMIQASLGLFTMDDVKLMLRDPDLNVTNTKIIASPPHGLYLKNVRYDPKGLNNLFGFFFFFFLFNFFFMSLLTNSQN